MQTIIGTADDRHRQPWRFGYWSRYGAANLAWYRQLTQRWQARSDRGGVSFPRA
ncbi:MAG: hypothetical protein ACXIU7_12305 [Roseinatronobacter sp.]